MIETVEQLAEWLRGLQVVPGANITDSLVRAVRNQPNIYDAVRFLVVQGGFDPRRLAQAVDRTIVETAITPSLDPASEDAQEILARRSGGPAASEPPVADSTNPVSLAGVRTYGNQTIIYDESGAPVDVVTGGAAAEGGTEGGLQVVGDINGNPVYEDGAGQRFISLDGGETFVSVPPGQPINEEPAPDFLGGFPADYQVLDPELMQRRAELISRLDTQAGGQTDLLSDLNYRTPRYYPLDQWQLFGSKSPEYQAEVKSALLAAGLISEKEAGVRGWQTFHAAAMAEAMVVANGTGKTWVDVLEELASSQVPGEGERGPLAGRRLTLPAFREPDYATLSQAVKGLFRQQVKRNPRDWELALLADQLNQDYRDLYDSEVQAARQEFAAENKAIVAASEGAGPVETSAGSVETVDPANRLRERFETRYADELALREDQATRANDVSHIMSVLTQTSRALGGGVT